MRLNNGKSVDAGKKYMVAGWATVGSQSPGEPIWDVVADYLRTRKTARITKFNTPRIVGLGDNAGLADYSA